MNLALYKGNEDEKKTKKNIKVFLKSVDQYNRGTKKGEHKMTRLEIIKKRAKKRVEARKTMKRNGKFLGSFEIDKAKEIAKKLLAKGILTHMFGNAGQVILFLGTE